MTPSAFKALGKLKKIRERELDEVRMVLSRCIAEEKIYEDKIAKLEDEIERNNNMMSEEKNRMNDMLSSSYRSWIPLAREQVKENKEALRIANARTDEVRIIFREALKNLKGTEILIESEEKRREIERQKAEQNDIDERAQILKAKEMMEDD